MPKHDRSESESDNDRKRKKHRKEKKHHASSDEEEPKRKKKVDLNPKNFNLDVNRMQDSVSIISYLCELYPDAESTDSLKQLFKTMDDENSVDIEKLEDKRVKCLLYYLLSSDVEADNWSKHVHKSRSSRHPLKFKKKSKALKYSFENAMSSVIKSKSTTKTISATEKELTVEEKARKLVEDYNKAFRGKSLVEEHQERKIEKYKRREERRKRKGDSDDSESSEDDKESRERRERQKLAKKGYLAFDHERDMGSAKPLDPTRVKNMVKNASDLNNRFDSRMQTSFM